MERTNHWILRAAGHIPLWMLLVIAILTQLLLSMILPVTPLGAAFLMSSGAIQGWALGTLFALGRGSGDR